MADVMSIAEKVTHKQRYESLKVSRNVYLDRAREAAKLTLPMLIPEEGHSASSTYETPHQSVGSRGVNNLASKLLLSLFPPNSPFFAMKVDDLTAEELGGNEGARAKVDQALGTIERTVMADIEQSGDRAAHFEALKHLIVGGNVLLQLPQSGGTRVFPLSRYVVSRDPLGAVQEIIIEEPLLVSSLSAEMKALLSEHPEHAPKGEADETINLYTKYIREGSKIKSSQQLGDVPVPGSEGSWPIDKSPVLALRWTRIDGEDYGRGYVEEYAGDLMSLEGLSQALLEGSAAAARLVFLVSPNGMTRLEDVFKTENGGGASGRAEDITTLQADKHADFSVAQRQIDSIIERLSYAFLMNSAVQRNGERVTAEEVRFMAGELEDALGGVYSILSQEYQLPYVNRVMARLTKARKIPMIPKEAAKPTIVTGLEALGRGHDLNKYDMFLKALMPLGPEVLSSELNVSDYIIRIGTALGIDINGLVKSDEQKQADQAAAEQAQAQAQVADLAKGAIPAIAKEGAPAVVAAMQEGT